MDICRGLEHAHGGGFVHRDLKPGNIWLAEDGTAKIGDFGIAVSLDRTRLTQEGMMVGTATYIPPEQALGGAVTPQSDLYSFGAMLYELVAGLPPFVGGDLTAVISQHINTQPVAPSWHSEHCPPDLEALILQLLAKVPEDRPASASEVLAALGRVDPAGMSAQPSDANPLDRLARGVFVGREQELDRLRSAFDQTLSGAGRVVMVVGEPGIGKTRTVMEVETHARMRGAQVLWGRAHEASGAPAYWPWVQALRSHIATSDEGQLRSELGSGASEVARIVSDVRERLPDLPEPAAVTDPESAQFRLFDAVTAFLRNASTNAPLVVVFEDLHWADRPTLLLLQHLAREIARSRLLVVGTYRDADLDRQHPLSATLAEMNREQLFERVFLRGLTRDEVDTYVRQTANTEPSRAVLDRVYEETEGNPFFLSQVVALMAQQGTLTATSLSDVALPEGVVQALGQRLDRLSGQCNELLSIAAVSGREFGHESLAAATEHDDDTLLRLIEEALDGRVIEETSMAGEYRFTHALMQETLLGELSTARRVAMHARIAESLERLWGDRAERHAAELARHYAESARLNRDHAEHALHFSKLAAEQAERQFAWSEAARHYEQWLTLVSRAADGPGEDEADLLTAYGGCLIRAGDLEEGRGALMRAITLYGQQGSGVGQAHAALELSGAGVSGFVDQTYAEIADPALSALGDADAHLRARLLVARAADHLGPSNDAAADKAAALANAHGFADVEALLARRKAFRTWGHVPNLQSGRLFQAAYEQLAAAGFDREAAGVLGTAAYSLYFGGRLDEAEALFEETAELSDRVGATAAAQRVRADIARIALLRCDFERFEKLSATSPDPWGVLTIGRAEMTGDVDRALELLPDPPTGGALVPELNTRAARTRVLLSAGREREAREEFITMDALLKTLETGGPVLVHVVGLLDGAELAVADDARLLTLYDELRDNWTETPDDRFVVGGLAARGLDRPRALLALRLGHVGEAEERIGWGIEWARRERCPVEEGRLLQALAEVAVRRGNTSEAMEQLDAASKLFEQYGARLYLDQVIAKKLELQGVTPSDGSDAATIVAPEPGETLPSGGAAEGD